MFCREIECGPCGDLLLFDDVADAPPAARPDAWHVHLRRVGRKIPRPAAQLIRMHEHRRRQSRARRFSEHAGDVVERRNPVEPHVAPAGINRVADDACLAGGFELGPHMPAPPCDLAPHDGIAIRPKRLGVRRNIQTRVAAAHLVMIDVGLRHPLAIHHACEMLRLGQVQREAVAVVIVPRILLIKPRQARRLVRRAHVFHDTSPRSSESRRD